MTPRHVGVQRLEVFVAVMLARERRVLGDGEAGGCTELAAALCTLPSGLLEMIADAVAALGHAGHASYEEKVKKRSSFTMYPTVWRPKFPG